VLPADRWARQASLREAEARASLLGSVRDEISAFKAGSSSTASDALLSERGKIDSSHRMTDEILGCARARVRPRT
jgi:Golgi SNAP receptor complex protein 1